MKSIDLQETPTMTSYLRLNEHNSGKCGSIDVSVQSIDGSSITVLMPLPCTWTTSGMRTPVRPFYPTHPDNIYNHISQNKFDWPRRSSFCKGKQRYFTCSLSRSQRCCESLSTKRQTPRLSNWWRQGSTDILCDLNEEICHGNSQCNPERLGTNLQIFGKTNSRPTIPTWKPAWISHRWISKWSTLSSNNEETIYRMGQPNYHASR